MKSVTFYHEQLMQAFREENYALMKQLLAAIPEDHGIPTTSESVDRWNDLRRLLTTIGNVHPVYVADALGKGMKGVNNGLAEEAFRYAVAYAMQLHGDRSFDAARRILTLAHFLADVQKTDEAIQLLQVGILLLQDNNALGESDYAIPAESLFLADLYLASRDHVNAETILTKVISWYEALLNKTTESKHERAGIIAQLATAKLKLADHYMERTNPAAIDLYCELRETWLNNEGITIHQPMCYNRIGIVYEKMQYWPEAIAHYEKARQLLITYFGPSHTDLPWCEERLRHCSSREQDERAADGNCLNPSQR